MQRVCFVGLAVAMYFFSLAALGQDAPATSAPTDNAALMTTSVPRLMKFGGVLQDAGGKPLAGPVDVTFSIYKSQSDAAALWQETQTVQADARGQYAVLLGAMSAQGLPMELFTSGEAHWLGVSIGKLPEQPRVLLVSVPYALKAGDAETLGGKPASAYVVNESEGAGQAGIFATATPTAQGGGVRKKTTGTGGAALTSGTTGRIAKFINTTDLGNSVMFENTGKIGLGTASPAYAFDIYGTNAGMRLTGGGTHSFIVTGTASAGRLGQDANGFFFASDTNGQAIRFLTNNGALNEWLRITSAGNVGIGTTIPAAKLAVAGNVAATTLTTSGGATGITSTGISYGVKGYGQNGVYGESSDASGNGVWGKNLAHTGVYGDGGDAGVWGHTVNGNGVYGFSNNSHGVFGESGYIGVYGSGTTDGVYAAGGLYGVEATSTNNGHGVHGTSGYLGVYGSGGSYGVYGDGSAGGYGVYGKGDNGVRGECYGLTSCTGAAGIGGSTGSGIYGQGGGYGVYSAGNTGASGTKSAVVALPDNRVVELYAMESPDVWFEDFGTASLSKGMAEVTLDPAYALTVNTDLGYHVYLTANGESEGLYVAQKTPRGFQVREFHGGKSNISFDYRIVAKRRGFESVRLQEVDADAEAIASVRAQNHAKSARPMLRIPKKLAVPEAPSAPAKVEAREPSPTAQLR